MSTPLPNPMFPIFVFDTDDPIEYADLERLMEKDGITLLTRCKEGPEQRGGYYFQFKPISKHQIRLYTFDQNDYFDMPKVQLLKLINHCAGLAFDEDMLRYCQNTIDLRND